MLFLADTTSTTVALAADRRKKSKGPGLKVLQVRAFTRGVFHVSRVPAFPPFLVSYLADTIRGCWYVNESSSALAACSGLGMWRGGTLPGRSSAHPGGRADMAL